jgi:amidase
MKSMQDVLQYNAAHADVALKFGQAQFVESQKLDVSPGSADTVQYEADKAAGITWARDRIDGALTRGTAGPSDDLAAIAYPNSGSAGVGARALYPSIVVPAGYTATHRRPAGLSFLGTAFSEARLIGLAYDFEQASQAWRPPATINPSLFRCADERVAGCAP